MTRPKDRYHHCAFHAPPGFVLEERACAIAAAGDCDHCHPPGGGITLTLIRRVAAVGVPDWSTSQSDLRPSLFPATLTLTTPDRQSFATPLDYLRTAEGVLAPGLPGYRLDFCRPRQLRQRPAACAQARFRSGLELLRLAIAWEQGPNLLVASLILAAAGAAGSWGQLEAFAESVELSISG